MKSVPRHEGFKICHLIKNIDVRQLPTEMQILFQKGMNHE